MRLRTLAFISIVALVRADAGWCEEAKASELDRWIPSFGVSIGVIRQSASGFQVNNLRPPDDSFPPPGPFPGTPSDGADYMLDPFAVANFELMSPGLGAIPGVESIPGRPRLFVHGEVGGALSSDVALAEEGSPGELTLPPNPTAGLPGLAVGGQGTRTEASIDTLVAGVGAGIAFTADLFDRRFRLKPSFEYLRDGVTARGDLKHVSGLFPNWNFLIIRNQEERTLNYIGGGLELEMDTVRLGPFVLAVFANGQAYQLLDDRNIDLSTPNGTSTATCSDVTAPPSACWDVKLDRDLYRGSVGLRFRFFPVED